MREGKHEKQTILTGVIYGESVESGDLAGILLYYYASCC